jgi:hypothetical protein
VLKEELDIQVQGVELYPEQDLGQELPEPELLYQKAEESCLVQENALESLISPNPIL